MRSKVSCMVKLSDSSKNLKRKNVVEFLFFFQHFARNYLKKGRDHPADTSHVLH